MLTTLSTLKSRLGILETDIQYDAILTNAIKAVSARFDKETRRSLAPLSAIWVSSIGNHSQRGPSATSLPSFSSC